jgi:hypothetical protein
MWIACLDADRTVCCAWVVYVHCRPPPCADCARDGESTPAEYTCCQDKCDLKALCGAHVTAHRQWGHTVSVLVPDDTTGAPTPDTLRGVTHCALTEHAGAEGVLTHVCKPCDGALVCRACINGHLGGGHGLCSMESAADEATAKAAAGLPVLREGLAHQVSMPWWQPRLGCMPQWTPSTRRCWQTSSLRTMARWWRCRWAWTVAVTAEAGFGATTSPVMRTHVGASVAASMGLAQCRDGVNADVATLGFEGLSEEELCCEAWSGSNWHRGSCWRSIDRPGMCRCTENLTGDCHGLRYWGEVAKDRHGSALFRLSARGPDPLSCPPVSFTDGSTIAAPGCGAYCPGAAARPQDPVWAGARSGGMPRPETAGDLWRVQEHWHPVDMGSAGWYQWRWWCIWRGWGVCRRWRVWW